MIPFGVEGSEVNTKNFGLKYFFNIFCCSAVQYSREVNGRCGVCGDSWLDPPPRKHETGGVYAKGIIGRRYTSGQLIKIEVEVTINHQGTMEVRLCPSDVRTTAESQECFDR